MITLLHHPGGRLAGIGRIRVRRATRFNHAVALLASNWPILGTALFHLERGCAGKFPDVCAPIAHFMHAEREWQDFVQRCVVSGELTNLMSAVTRGDR